MIISILFRLAITIFVIAQVIIMWVSTPHHPAAYVIDVIASAGAVWICWALWWSRMYQ